MSYMVEFEVGEAESVFVEIAGDPPAGPELASRGGVLVEKAETSFAEAIDRLKPTLETIIDRIEGLARRPDDVTVELGVKLSAKAGAVIASTDAEANLKLALTWRRTPSVGTAG